MIQLVVAVAINQLRDCLIVTDTQTDRQTDKERERERDSKICCIISRSLGTRSIYMRQRHSCILPFERIVDNHRSKSA